MISQRNGICTKTKKESVADKKNLKTGLQNFKVNSVAFILANAIMFDIKIYIYINSINRRLLNVNN